MFVISNFPDQANFKLVCIDISSMVPTNRDDIKWPVNQFLQLSCHYAGHSKLKQRVPLSEADSFSAICIDTFLHSLYVLHAAESCYVSCRK